MKISYRLSAAAALAAALLTLPSVEAMPAAAASPPDVLAHAPVYQIYLDNSGSSPATDAAFMAQVAPLAVAKLRSLPLGTTVIVNSVGDATRNPLQWRTRIQLRHDQQGAPLEDIARGLQKLLTEFPARVAGKEHGRSDLIGGFFDAAQNVNANSEQNQILVVSDLIENSNRGDCFQKCKLPDKPNFDLRKTNVSVYGVGRGLPSEKAESLTLAWKSFLVKSGATVDLHRTF